MTPLLIGLVALPAVAGSGLALAGRRADRIAPGVGVAVAAVVLGLAVAAAATDPGVDATARGLLPTVAGVAVVVLLFTAGQGVADAARFHGLLLLFVAAVLLTLTAATLPVLLAGWEVMGAVSYALIGHDRSTTGADAGLTAFVTTRATDLGLYLAVGAAVVAGTGPGLDALAAAPRPALDVVVAGIVVAALGKAAQLPVSFWLSRAMVAPSPVSALLHSAAMVAMGGWLLLRIEPLIVATGWAGPVLGWLGALTTVVLGAIALAQRDLKQLLAASTAAQLGVVVLAAGVDATRGGVLQLVAHAPVKALLFLAAGAWLAGEGTSDLARLAGVGRRSVPTGVLVTLAAGALAGLPLSPLGAAKDAVLAAALRADPALFAAGLVGAVLTAASATRIVLVLWRRPLAATPTDPQIRAEQPSVRGIELAALVLLAIALLGVTVAALPGTPAAGGSVVLATALAALAGIALTVLRGGRPTRRGRTWFRLEAVTLRRLVRPVERLAMTSARFDDRLAAAVVGGAVGVRRAAAGLARADAALARAVHGGGGVRAATGLVTRAQSGSLQTYYFAGVALVAALVVLAVAAR